MFGDQLTIDVSYCMLYKLELQVSNITCHVFSLSVQQYVIAVAIIFGVLCVLYSNHAVSQCHTNNKVNRSQSW